MLGAHALRTRGRGRRVEGGGLCVGRWGRRGAHSRRRRGFRLGRRAWRGLGGGRRPGRRLGGGPGGAPSALGPALPTDAVRATVLFRLATCSLQQGAQQQQAGDVCCCAMFWAWTELHGMLTKHSVLPWQPARDASGLHVLARTHLAQQAFLSLHSSPLLRGPQAKLERLRRFVAPAGDAREGPGRRRRQQARSVQCTARSFPEP